MKIKPNDIYSPVIPENVKFEVVEKNELTVVKFKEQIGPIINGSEKKPIS